MEFLIQPERRVKSLLSQAVSGVWLGLLLAGSAVAQDAQTIPLYQNLQSSYYFIPTPAANPPPIDATAFDNENVFSVSFVAQTKTLAVYENENTLDITNGENGLMIVNGPTNNPDLDFILSVLSEPNETQSEGFRFDDYNPVSNRNSMAGTFYNQGVIRCDSITDGNNAFNYLGNDYNYLNSLGQCYISATNVYNPGDIDVGVNGLVQIAGQAVDLSRGAFTVEPTLPTFNYLYGYYFFNSFNQPIASNVNFNGGGNFGGNTNGWIPGLNLTATSAEGSYPDYPRLTNTTAYITVQQYPQESNNIIRAVFIANTSPNATANVYFEPLNALPTLGFELGAADVEWVGTRLDPSTGGVLTNYFYLTDNYVFGSSTNVLVIGGLPDNFILTATNAPQLSGLTPASPGFFNDFPVAVVTNSYAYFDGTITANNVVTNITATNPHGAITNLPGRIQIVAGTELNLSNTVISGENYLSIVATNQFDGSGGATIAAPYSDISLGSVSGGMTVSNLLESGIPNWSGTLEVWSARWITVDATGFTNDYRVLLVGSDLSPYTLPWVQNLKLHATNSLVISDVLNVYGTLSVDSANLTIATNGFGNGATSSEGELNGISSVNIGPAQLPNLRWLTNNGALTSQNIIILTNASHYGSVVNNGLIADQGTIVFATNFVNAGTVTNGTGNFTVQSPAGTATNGFIIMTNGSVYAGGSVSFSANNICASNVFMKCLSLTLNPVNFISDGGVSNGNIWTVGRASGTGGGGFALLNNPTNGADLLGTTITNLCPGLNKQTVDTWAGRDYGPSNDGYTSNAALGRLILDVAGPSSLITFKAASSTTNNALYVDSLEFRDYLTNGINTSFDFSSWLSINTNMVIYFAQAYINGISVAEKINDASLFSGKNGGSVGTNGVVVPGRLRWVPTYAGYFSSTNFVVNGVTNSYNAALAVSPVYDSNGNGIANAYDPAPFAFPPSALNFTLTVTNHPSRAVLTWDTVPLADNSVYYAGTLAATNWLLYTNFLSTNAPGPWYPVTVYDTNVLTGMRFYKVLVQP